MGLLPKEFENVPSLSLPLAYSARLKGELCLHESRRSYTCMSPRSALSPNSFATQPLSATVFTHLWLQFFLSFASSPFFPSFLPSFLPSFPFYPILPSFDRPPIARCASLPPPSPLLSLSLRNSLLEKRRNDKLSGCGGGGSGGPRRRGGREGRREQGSKVGGRARGRPVSGLGRKSRLTQLCIQTDLTSESCGKYGAARAPGRKAGRRRGS